MRRYSYCLYLVVVAAGCSAAVGTNGDDEPDAEASMPVGGRRDAALPRTFDAALAADARPSASTDEPDAGLSVQRPDGGPDAAPGPDTRASAVSDAARTTDVPSGADRVASSNYTCNMVLGIATTGEWFAAGFEKVVDNARWEAIPVHDGHIELWADPNHPIWATAIKSPCATNAKTPDRIVFTGVNYAYTTVAEFLPKYIAVLDNIKAKYPSVKRVDVMTYTRAPGNIECKDASRSRNSWIKPAQDEAIALLVNMYPGFVFAAPKWEVRSCADFRLCPHLTDAANDAIARTIGGHFLTH